MSSETFSTLLRPQGSTSVHHAAVTGFVFLEDVELLHDPSLSPRPNLTSSTAQRVTSKAPLDPASNHRPSLHSALSHLSTPGPTTITPPFSLITSSRDATIRLYSLPPSSPPSPLSILTGHTEWISSILTLPDRRTLISASSDSTVRLWDMQTGLTLQTLTRHSDYVECMAYSAEGNVLATAGLGNEVYLWRLDGEYPVPSECLRLGGREGEGVGSVYGMDMGEGWVVTGGTDRVVRCWDVRTGKVALKLLGHSANVRSVKMKDDGWACLSVGSDNEIRVWDLRKQRCSATHHVRPALLAMGGVESGKMKPSCYTMTVNESFSQVYTGHSTGLVACTHLDSGRVEPIITLPSSIITLQLDRHNRLWCADSDSNITAWAQPLTRHPSFDVDDPASDDDDIPPPTLSSPLLSLPGIPPLKRARVTGDGWHVLSQDSVGCCHLWDVVSQRMLKSYGLTSFDGLLSRKNAEGKGGVGGSWCSVDVRLGCLCVTMERRNAWNAVYTIESPPLPDGEEVEDVRVNLGEAAVQSALSEWVGLERLAVAVQSGLEWVEDGIEETAEETVMFSPLVSPRGSQLPSSASPSIVSVKAALIVTFPRAQRRPPLYLTLPIPPLPSSLAPHSSSLSDERQLELDRRRAIYYATVPGWVEERVMSGMERTDRPPEDLLPDVMVNVKDWIGEEGEDEGEEVEEEDDDEGEWSSKREDSLSHNLLTSEPIHIHSSLPHRLAPSHSRHSLSSRSARRTSGSRRLTVGHSPSASPIPGARPSIQHPSVPRVNSSSSLTHSHSPIFKQLSHSPLDSFDLNAPSPYLTPSLDPTLPRLSFYLLPLPSSSLPSAFTGPILLPSSTNVRRVVQFLVRRLNNVGEGEVSEREVEVLMGNEVLKGEETWEEVRGRWKGELGVKGMKVYYRRKDGEGENNVDAPNGHPTDLMLTASERGPPGD